MNTDFCKRNIGLSFLTPLNFNLASKLIRRLFYILFVAYPQQQASRLIGAILAQALIQYEY